MKMIDDLKAVDIFVLGEMQKDPTVTRDYLERLGGYNRHYIQTAITKLRKAGLIRYTRKGEVTK